MITFCVAVALIIPTMIADWFVFLKQLDPRHAELTKASHGVMMVIGAGVAWKNGFYPGDVGLALLAFIAAWGVFWAVLGATRSAQGYRDGRLIGRAAAKIALGGGIYFWLLPQWEVTLVWHQWVYNLGVAVAVFCVVTGAVKVLLLLRPPPTLPMGGGGNMPHGDAGFSGGGGLGG